MRYQGSVEDRVHELLSYRLESIYEMFGQVPDILEDVWIDVVNGEIEKAKQLIESVHPKHPFDERYNRVEQIDWESCSEVLDSHERIQELKKGWKN